MEDLGQAIKIRQLLTVGIKEIKIKWHRLTKKEIAIASNLMLKERATIEDQSEFSAAIKTLQKLNKEELKFNALRRINRHCF